MVATSKFGLLTIKQHSVIRKQLFLYPQGDMSGLRKPKKDKHQPAAVSISVHLPRPVSTDLTIKTDSVLTNTIEKDGVQDWSM